ncbi:hypothetical protein U9M48_023930 [Paspalum notatum var. saurae]|uniref:Transposase n=1 Tax=Paspalum notatum var. saurae TaxID=547442 RepID=A0AAQ3WVI5_PASNO
MWYLNPIDRLRRIFANPAFAKLMRWWFCERTKDDEKLSHLADATQWQRFDELYPEFTKDPRNVRNSTNSTWPVILSIYNLSSWLCQKRKYAMLCGLIQGPKQPGIDIDVFLAPLMEDMAKLWNDGVKMTDSLTKKDFTLRGMILTMINNCHANFSLSGQIKGKKGCLSYLDATASEYLDGSKKVVYTKKQFNNQFDGKDEKGSVPRRRHDSKHVFDMVKKINIVYGKKIKRTKHPIEGVPFKKQSIFFKYLPYWKDLEVPHATDCVHLKKNMFDSTICTLIDVKGKTKDSQKSPHDLVNMKIRSELHPVEQGNGKFKLPAASFNLTSAEKRELCLCLRDLTKGDSKDELDSLQEFCMETMAQLEMCFPPSFFDIMPRLIVHMVDQIRALCPIYLHEMWAYERFMSTLNRYFLNRAYPEGCMIEAYCTEEVVECCKDYLVDKKGIGLLRLSRKGTRGRKTFIDNAYEEVAKVHFSVLHQIEMMTPFVEQHIAIIRAENPERSDSWIMKEHKHRFTSWLMDLNLPEGSTAEEVTLKRLASGPSSRVTTWQAYDINGQTFYTAAKDKKSVCKNIEVRIDAMDDGTGSKVTYFGFIEDIWELDYGLNIQIPVFRCQWVKHPQGVLVDNYELTIVDLAKVGYKNDPWVLAKRIGQVLYIIDPRLKN